MPLVSANRRVFFYLLMAASTVGCYVPVRAPAVKATELPDTFREPRRVAGYPLNFAHLTVPPPAQYRLQRDDTLDVIINDLFPGTQPQPVRARVQGDGMIHLPLVGNVSVIGLDLSQAAVAVEDAYRKGFLREPRVNVTLAEKGTVNILVLGEVARPGVYRLPHDENDVGNALAAAGGLSENAAEMIEVHRRTIGTVAAPPLAEGELCMIETVDTADGSPRPILQIPLYGIDPVPDDVKLSAGDVVVVPSRRNEVFFVVGPLAERNFVQFSLGGRDRELGNGLLLPRGQEIDVVKAVVMAGYIDPVTSPTTATVHRIGPNGQPMLLKVNLIKARYNARETVIVEPGDIIYLNPDFPWYMRRLVDQILPGAIGDLFRLSYQSAVGID